MQHGGSAAALGHIVEGPAGDNYHRHIGQGAAFAQLQEKLPAIHEAFLLIEFSNILATYQRSGALGRGAAEGLLATAERMVTGLVNLPPARALKLAAEFGVSAYDARFLGAAQSLGAKLVTEDGKLRAAAPALTHSLSQALGG